MQNFNTPTKIVFGEDSLIEVKRIIEDEKFKSALIVTDEGISKTSIIEALKENVKNIKYDIYAGSQPNPTIDNCNEALKKLQKIEADIVIAIGGGSSIDVAKAISLLATNGGTIDQYEGIDKFEHSLLPLLAVPTTAGTASEVTNFTVITDEAKEYKLTVGGPRISPKWAVLDPKLTLTLPSTITASTGLDALVHAIESYTSKKANTITKTLAREAIRKISANLRQAVFNGDTLYHREEMLMGSLLAGMAFNNTRLGNCHALSHPISAVYGVPHGVANAILIPHVMDFNLKAVPELFADIAYDMGEILNDLNLIEQADRAVRAVRNLAEDIGIPSSFQSYNVSVDQIDKMAEDALLSGNISVNPRTTTKDEVIKLYKKSIEVEK